MRVLIQRVRESTVTVDGETVGAIGAGLTVLVGVGPTDGEAEAALLARKTAELRIFEDANGKTNLAITEVGGAVLVISQFTLYADCRKGRRPSFIRAASPAHAEPLVDHYAALLRGYGLTVAEGQFGTHMVVSIVNDGPFTIWLDTDELNVGTG